MIDRLDGGDKEYFEEEVRPAAASSPDGWVKTNGAGPVAREAPAGPTRFEQRELDEFSAGAGAN